MIYLLLIPLVVMGVASSLFYKLNNRGTLVTLFAQIMWAFIVFSIAFGVGFAVHDDVLRGVNWASMGLILLSVVFLILCIVTWVLGIKYVPISIASPFTQMSMIFLLGASWLIFGDNVGTAEIVLVLIIFFACIMKGYFQYKQEPCKLKSKELLIGLLWLFLWVVCVTANIVTKREIVGNLDVHVTTFNFFRSSISVAVCFVALLIFRVPIKSTLKDTFTNKNLVGIGLMDSPSALFFLPLAIVMNLGVLDAILTITTVLTVLAGVVLLKEKIRPSTIIPIAIIIACSIALALVSV
ncbi:MAG: hypothetical protein FWC00_00610 [Firmicutes bacterium]|nr:hypothetical protein [Bacillota bacterium]